jgi:hypothetical protein
MGTAIANSNGCRQLKAIFLPCKRRAKSMKKDAHGTKSTAIGFPTYEQIGKTCSLSQPVDIAQDAGRQKAIAVEKRYNTLATLRPE